MNGWVEKSRNGVAHDFIKLPLEIIDENCLLPERQQVLLIDGPGQSYRIEQDHDIPLCEKDNEILVKVVTVGLNPIDHKGPDFGFGLPSLPWINGRDLAGVVIKASSSLSRIRTGDVILSPSTDYRDRRKAAFQQYVVTAEHNVARIPRRIPIQNGAVIGVAFVTAAIALGICLGLSFSPVPVDDLRGPDLLRLIREVDTGALAEDIRDECLYGVQDHERAKAGDWLAIWGASAATGFTAVQLAKFMGLRVICIVDVARHGERLMNAGADLLVDRVDEDRVVEIIRSVTKGRLRFALDVIGRDSASRLQDCLDQGTDSGVRSHLVGLTGLPKSNVTNVVKHKLPIKIFHDVERVGESLMVWLEQLLQTNSLVIPEVEKVEGGLHGINKALDTMRSGSVAGKRMAVPLNKVCLVPV